MPADYFIGDNYKLEEDSNGDFEVIDTNNNTTVITHDNTADTVTINSNLDVGTLVDAALTDEIDSAQINADAVDSAQINADAVDSAQITGAAVVQAAIASGAVGVDELADALGTSSSDRIPGETFFTTATAGTTKATDQSQLKATLDSDKSDNAGGFKRIVDTEVTDTSDILSGGNEITPDTTGKFRIEAHAKLTGGSQGDAIQMRLQNFKSLSTVFETFTTANSNGVATASITGSFTLSGGTAYYVDVSNTDSGYTIKSDTNVTKFEAYRRTAQP